MDKAKDGYSLESLKKTHIKVRQLLADIAVLVEQVRQAADCTEKVRNGELSEELFYIFEEYLQFNTFN